MGATVSRCIVDPSCVVLKGCVESFRNHQE